MNAVPASAISHFQRGDFVEADKLLAECLAREPANADALHLRGIIALQARHFARAKDFLTRALDLEPHDPEIAINLGMALNALNEFSEGARILSRAIERDAARPEGRLLLGRSLLGLDQAERADAEATSALSLRPGWVDALELKSSALFRLRRYDQALAAGLSLLTQDPKHVRGHRLVASIYTERGDFEQAFAHYQKALAVDPSDGTTHGNLGRLLIHLNRHADAVGAYRKGLSLAPNDPHIRAGLGVALLATGKIDEGWPLYQARLSSRETELPMGLRSLPFLNDLPKAGQRVLLWTDQGIGEQILFASLIPELARSGAALTIACTLRLVPVFARSFPGVEIIPHTDLTEDEFHRRWDAFLCLGDAARWLRNDFDSFPPHNGYLVADRDRTVRMRDIYRGKKTTAPLVGISWRTSDDAEVGSRKSIPLKHWSPILTVPGSRFVSLQYGDCDAEISAAKRAVGVSIYSDHEVDPLEDLDTFASQIAAMDFVVTTSSATAHMAGALGVPVWTLVPSGFAGLWHWFLVRTDSPWYPSMTLVRQEAVGDWDLS